MGADRSCRAPSALAAVRQLPQHTCLNTMQRQLILGPSSPVVLITACHSLVPMMLELERHALGTVLRGAQLELLSFRITVSSGKFDAH